MRSEDDLDRLLAAFVRKDPEAAKELPLAASSTIRGLARRFGPDLPADMIDEVVSETYLLLLGRSGRRFDSRLGSAREFLFGIVANAVKNIRASYRPPGFHSRYQEHDSTNEKIFVFDETVHGAVDLPLAQVESSVDLARLLSGISSLLAAAIIAIYVQGETSADVVQRFGVSRFQIYRTMRGIRARALSKTLHYPELGSAA